MASQFVKHLVMSCCDPPPISGVVALIRYKQQVAGSRFDFLKSPTQLPLPCWSMCNKHACLSMQWWRLCLLTCSSSLTPLSWGGLSAGPGEKEENRRENKQGDTSAVSQLPAEVTHLKEVPPSHFSSFYPFSEPF